MISVITAHEAQKLVEQGQAILVDIREEGEYRQMHIENSYLKPLSLLPDMPGAENRQSTAIFLCRSGNRTQANQALLEKQGYAQSYIMEGGILGWQAEGLPVRATGRLPIMRQVQLTAGLLIVLFIILSIWVPALRWLAGLVGLGLLVAGLSGFCGMARLLQLMPWNKA